jgi:hypothetical protein
MPDACKRKQARYWINGLKLECEIREGRTEIEYGNINRVPFAVDGLYWEFSSTNFAMIAFWA